MYNYIKGFRIFSPCSNNKSVECVSKNNFSFWNNMSCFNRISALTWRHLIFLFLCAIACYQWWVGSEDEINMKRTEMDIYDYLYNEMLYVPMHRITTGSTKEGLRLSAPDVDTFCYLSNHHGVWDSIGAKMYDSTIERVFLMEN